MITRLFTTLVSQGNLVVLRDRTRQAGELFGLDKTQRTRFITAVSEIARNTIQYAGQGTASFQFDSGDGANPVQGLVVQMADKGPGIVGLAALLEGGNNSRGQLPMGIAGSRRLVDALDVECPAAGGTIVTIGMSLPKYGPILSAADVAQRMDLLARRKPQTPLEQLELQNREMLFTLNELRLRQLELQQADERKNQFLSTVAHELRNPLSTMQMTLAVMALKTNMTAAELAQKCAVMDRQTVQLARLVDDLMDVSRVTHGKVELARLPTEVNALVSQAVEMSGGAIQARAHQITVTLAPVELWVLGDAARLKQVLCNLIQNAARYTPEKGTIAISVRQESAFAVVDVADNGIGIAPDVLPTVFDLFVQGGSHSAGNPGGLGVGLTLVQRLTRDHGGTVAAASEGLGRGSSFTVTLPLSSVPPPAVPADAPETTRSQERELASKGANENLAVPNAVQVAGLRGRRDDR